MTFDPEAWRKIIRAVASEAAADGRPRCFGQAASVALERHGATDDATRKLVLGLGERMDHWGLFLDISRPPRQAVWQLLSRPLPEHEARAMARRLSSGIVAAELADPPMPCEVSTLRHLLEKGYIDAETARQGGLEITARDGGAGAGHGAGDVSVGRTVDG